MTKPMTSRAVACRRAGTLVPEKRMPCAEDGCAGMLRRIWTKFGWFYGCNRYPACRGGIGCHPNGAPLGKPANRATKQLRIEAHAAFDPLWKSGSMRRPQAYAWLRHRFGTGEHVHIAELDADGCRRVIELCNGFEHEYEKEADGRA